MSDRRIGASLYLYAVFIKSDVLPYRHCHPYGSELVYVHGVCGISADGVFHHLILYRIVDLVVVLAYRLLCREYAEYIVFRGSHVAARIHPGAFVVYPARGADRFRNSYCAVFVNVRGVRRVEPYSEEAVSLGVKTLAVSCLTG